MPVGVSDEVIVSQLTEQASCMLDLHGAVREGTANTGCRVRGLALDRVRPGEDRGGQGIPARAGVCGAQIPRIRRSRWQGHSEDLSVLFLKVTL